VSILKGIINIITNVLNQVYRLLIEYSKIVLLVMVFIISAQVFSRNLLKFSIRWSEEVALLLMVWMAFIGIAIGVSSDLHISISLFYKRFPGGLQKAIDIINQLVTFVFGLFLLIFGHRMAAATVSSTLPATKWPTFIFYLMIPVSGFYICYYSFLKLFNYEKKYSLTNS
jgi:TRAP-type C4-dicarboxylate transport system permease small subunit